MIDRKITKKELEKISIKQTIIRTLVVLIGNLIGFFLLSQLDIGIQISNYTNAIILIIILSIINSLLWIILSNFFIPFLIATLGLGSFILNGIVLFELGQVFQGIYLTTASVFIAPFVMAIITTILSTILTVDDDTSYYRAVIRNSIRRKAKTVKIYPGLIILEIDGLAKNIINEAIDKGYMPTLKKWIDEKSHIITPWETDLSSQTAAGQAGILHGNNEDIIAFRWVEKENDNKIVECVGFSDAPMIEKRISNGKGLLVDEGASRSNLFSGDTNNIIFTYSKILDFKKSFNSAWYAVYSHPNNFPRIIILGIWEIFIELKSRIVHIFKNIKPRIPRGVKYIFTRAFANVFMREVTTQTLIGDMLVGDVDVAYATYLGYDEVAHHSGIRDQDVWPVLKSIDMQIHRLKEASRFADRDYYFVIQSDHGQGNGNTFKQRYGIKFEDYVRSFLPEDMTMISKMDSNKDHFNESFIPYNEHLEQIKEKYHDSFLENTKNIREKYKNVLDYIQGYKPSPNTGKKPEKSEMIVLASGNLSLIYFTQLKKRLNFSEIVRLSPDLIPGLVNHEGIGFILVNSESGGMVIGKNGIYYLDEDKIEGENPLKDFGKNAVKHLKRANKFKYTPDILVNSFYDPETEEICAFEELVGSHGGLGGTQTEPFIMHPSDWEIEEELIGAESIYRLLKKEINQMKKR
ncbi:phage holin family protein [Methanobrevibacter sp. OttesenSCG-928-K11]|nr:phage holin family protein [Methanobrevibacter sp. OttesenSCG-928-K11]